MAQCADRIFYFMLTIRVSGTSLKKARTTLGFCKGLTMVRRPAANCAPTARMLIRIRLVFMSASGQT